MRLALFTIVALTTLVIPAFAAERSEVPDQYKWDRTHIFKSDKDWERAKEKAAARIPEIAAYEGRLGESAAVLHEALSTLLSIYQDLSRVSTYSNMLRDEDTRNSKSQEMAQSVGQIFTKMGTASAYIQPELLAMGPERVAEMIKEEPKLNEYRVYLEDIVRYTGHTLSPKEEKIVAQASNLSGAGNSIAGTFRNADMPYPEVTLSNGETVKLDAQGYSKYRSAPNREDRIKVFQAFWGEYQKYRRTLATSLYSAVKGHLFDKEVHNYDSCLQAALFNYNIPVSVYHQLVEDVNTNLPTLHRYLKLKEKMLGLEKIGYEDLYVSSVKQIEKVYSPEEAIDLCVDSNKILGEEYVKVLGNAFKEGWMDIMPTPGKRSGAYSTMVYGVHPYQLLNFNGDYESVSTLAHESGHSMHSYLAAKAQPYVTSDYSIFVAEVASTLNENLLFYHMLDGAKDVESQLFLLGNALENFRTTLFRQAMFAEFELAIHEMVENGQPLTGDNLNELYLGLVRKYYGHDQGICNVDELYAVEWAYIPHFFYNFYVYQYSTSLVAGTTLANGVREEMAKGITTKRDAYLNMLSSGSSKFPIDLLKDAGVDMTSSTPFAEATREMNGIMDRIEALLEIGSDGEGGKTRD